MESASVRFILLLLLPAAALPVPRIIGWLNPLQQVAITHFCTRPT
jgi:hypothetical protein